MSARIVVRCDTAPAPIGPYSQAIKQGNLLFLSGQIGLDPATNQMVPGETAHQAHQIFLNIDQIMQFCGITMGNIARLVVYLVDLNDAPVMNKLIEHHFPYEPPVRTTVQVAALPAGARVEVEVTAVIPEHKKSLN